MINELFERELGNTSLNDISLADYIKENYIVKRLGKWIERQNIVRLNLETTNLRWKYECSECGYEVRSKYHYCPNCGAKMIEPQESEGECKNCVYYRNPDYTRCHECKAESEDKE